MTAYEARAYIAAHQPELDSALNAGSVRFIYAVKVDMCVKAYDAMLTARRADMTPFERHLVAAVTDWKMCMKIDGKGE